MNSKDIFEGLIDRLYRESSRSLRFAIDRHADNYLIAEDGTFLGKIIADQYDSNSIFNRFGDHGSKYALESIFNKYGTYGGKYSLMSPFNKYSSAPPKIYLSGVYMGRLTMNKYLPDAIPTDVFLYRVLNEFGLSNSGFFLELIADQIS